VNETLAPRTFDYDHCSLPARLPTIHFRTHLAPQTVVPKRPLAELAAVRTSAEPRRDGDVARALLALGHGPAGEWMEWCLPAAVGVLGILQAFGAIHSFAWATLAIVLLGSERVLTRFRKGSALFRLLQRVRRINTSFAGSLDSVLSELLRSGETRLTEARSKALCVALLERVRQYAELGLEPDPEFPLRATLAVPLYDEHGCVRSLRVWCYDEPYHDRRWSEFAIGLEGAPAAFRTGAMRVIADIRRVGGISKPELRSYRSVVSIPVCSGGPNGRALAVVSLDCSLPGWFREVEMQKKVVPLIQPVVNALALVLALRKPGEPHEFGS
jgi:hypothetical protein